MGAPWGPMGPHGAPGGLWGPLGHLSPRLRVGVPRRGEIFHQILDFFMIFGPKLGLLANVWPWAHWFGPWAPEAAGRQPTFLRPGGSGGAEPPQEEQSGFFVLLR